MQTAGRVRPLVAVLSCATAVLLAGCGAKKPAEPVVNVQVAKAEKADISDVVEGDAILYPVDQAILTPKIAAPIRRFYVERGSRVRKGQLLAVLENTDLEAQALDARGAYEEAQAAYELAVKATLPETVEQAQADLSAAEALLRAQEKLYESRKELYDQGALPRKELDQAAVERARARAQYNVAKRRLASVQNVARTQDVKAAAGRLASAEGKYRDAEAQLGFTEIRSPLDGVVTDRQLYVGEVSQPGRPLLTVMDTSRIVARLHLSPDQAAKLKPGNAATVATLEPAAEGAGKVLLVNSATDVNGTTVEVWVEAPNPKGQFRPGTTAQVRIVARTVKDAVVIPAVAVQTTEGKKPFVLVAGEDGRAHERLLTLGIREGNHVQVLSGLHAGETVITTGAYALADNTRIQVTTAPEAPATPPARQPAEGEDE